MTPARPLPVAVLLCDHGQATRRGPDLATVGARLAQLLPGVCLEVVEGLCERPAQVAAAVKRTKARRLVLAMCRPAPGAPGLQAHLRKAGVDPLGVERLDFSPFWRLASRDLATKRAGAVLAGAAARARAYRAARPQHHRLRWAGPEALAQGPEGWSLTWPTYLAVPAVEPERCAGTARCGLCARACPLPAVRTVAGRAAIDRERCEGCGLCVTACPVEAIEMPGCSLQQYEAQLATLLAFHRAFDEGPPVLALVCRRGAGPDGCSLWASAVAAGWLAVEVSCLAMVTAGWVLQALALGAAAVALLPCGESCPFDRVGAIEARVGYCRELLGLVGEPALSSRVQLVRPHAALPDPGACSLPPLTGPDGEPTSHPRLVEPVATAQAARRLACRRGTAPAGSVAYPACPTGVLQLNPQTCTLCGACAAACPTAALSLEADGPTASLTWDPAGCLGCSRCEAACPEAAATLTIRRATDLALLAGGRRALKRDAWVVCQRCGRPVAPRSLLQRVRSLLQEPSGPGLQPHLPEALCSACRADCLLTGPEADPAHGRSFGAG